MVRLWLAALIAGVCATNSSVHDSAARLSDHTEQSSAWSPTTSANASVYIVKPGYGRESAMSSAHRGGDEDGRAAHTAVARAGGLKGSLDKLKAKMLKTKMRLREWH